MRLPDGRRSRAVLLGTSEYVHSELTPLPAVRNNLSDLAAVLTSPTGTGIAQENCSVLLDETDVEALGHHVDTAAKQADDLLLVYYAGHGRLDTKGTLYLTLPRTNPGLLRWTGLPFQHVKEAILDSPANNRVLILDCCFSGRAIEAMADPQALVAGQIEIAGTYTITSTSANDPSRAPAGARHTAFTGHLLDLLTTGIPEPVTMLTLSAIYRGLLRSLPVGGFPEPKQHGSRTTDLLALAPNHHALRPAPPSPPAPSPPARAPVDLAALRGEFVRRKLSAEDVRNAKFSQSPIGRGYNEGEVDAFLDRVEAELLTGIDETGSMTPDDIRSVAFSKPPFMKRGYDEDEVDAFLDAVEGEIQRLGDVRARYHRAGG